MFSVTIDCIKYFDDKYKGTLDVDLLRYQIDGHHHPNIVLHCSVNGNVIVNAKYCSLNVLNAKGTEMKKLRSICLPDNNTAIFQP